MMYNNDKKHRILIVDDDPNLLRLMHDTLEAIGYSPISVPNGHHAIQLVKTEHIDLVIADISMPEMDGLQILQKVKEHDPNIPVLLITGVNMNNIKDRVYQYGADAFLDKPFRISRIEELLESLLSGKKQRAKVLVVDDNEDFRSVLAAQLEELGFRVYEAADGNEALEKMSRDHIHSVIADLKMPNLNGAELAKKLKSSSPFTHVILISGESVSPEDKENFKSFADAFLHKPFRLEQIKSMLEEFDFNSPKTISSRP
jgi:CheY-like chemotaxis protein